jgi:hypothetical protein
LTFRFTDEQWNALAELSGLPPEARTAYEVCARRYYYERAMQPVRWEAKSRDARKRLHRKIESVLEDDEWSAALASLYPFDNLEKTQIPEHALRRMVAKLAREGEPDASRTGPKSTLSAHRLISAAIETFKEYKPDIGVSRGYKKAALVTSSESYARSSSHRSVTARSTRR